MPMTEPMPFFYSLEKEIPSLALKFVEQTTNLGMHWPPAPEKIEASST